MGGGPRRPGFGKGPPRAQRPPSREDQRAAFEERVRDLATRTGIPPERARRVMRGEEQITDVIEDLAFRARVDVLMKRHDLNRALATQVELGQADLDVILARRKVGDELAAHRTRSVLDDAVGGGPLLLGVHGHMQIQARIVKVDRYEFDYVDLATNEPGRLHKLRVKYAWSPDDYKKLKKGIDHDPVRRAREIEPIPRPQDRYACSDRRIGLAWHRKTPVVITTLEGDRFTGEIAWIGRYELGLRVRQDKVLVVFRHAIDLFEEGPRPDKK